MPSLKVPSLNNLNLSVKNGILCTIIETQSTPILGRLAKGRLIKDGWSKNGFVKSTVRQEDS